MRHSKPRWGGLIDLAKPQPEGYIRETEQIKNQRGEWVGKRHSFKAARWTHPNGHPRCKLCLQEEPVGGVCTPPTDLAKPAIGYYPPKQLPQQAATAPETASQHVHEVQPPPEDDATVAKVAGLLIAGLAAEELARRIAQTLSPFGVTLVAVKAALAMSKRGTAPKPNVNHTEHGSELKGIVKGARDSELAFRAAYICNSAKRITASMRNGESLKDAVKTEFRIWQSHERARKARLKAATQVQTTAKTWGTPTDEGTLVGWYRNPGLNTETECATADGNNFYAEVGTVIGFPGAVHPNCGCIAGPPHAGAGMVDDEVAAVVRLVPNGKPKFKMRKR